MEKEKKNNSALIAVTVIMTLLVVALGGYIVYDKVLSNKDEEKTTTSTPSSNDKYEAKTSVSIVNEIDRDTVNAELNGKTYKLTLVYSYEQNSKKLFADKNGTKIDPSEDFYYRIYLTILFDDNLVNDSKTLIDVHREKDIATYKVPEGPLSDPLITGAYALRGVDNKQYLAVMIPEIDASNAEDIYETTKIVILNDRGIAITCLNFIEQPNVSLSEKIEDRLYDPRTSSAAPQGRLYTLSDDSETGSVLYYLDALNVVGESKTPISEYMYGTLQEYRVDIKDDEVTTVPLETYKSVCAGKC